jgi:hypothetical protein
MEGIPGHPTTARFNNCQHLHLTVMGTSIFLTIIIIIKEIKLGTSGYSDATVSTICGNGLVMILRAANGQVKISSDDS